MARTSRLASGLCLALLATCLLALAASVSARVEPKAAELSQKDGPYTDKSWKPDNPFEFSNEGCDKKDNAPEGGVQAEGSCSSGYKLCPYSLGGGCCKNGYKCCYDWCCASSRVCYKGYCAYCPSGYKACGNTCILTSMNCCSNNGGKWCDYGYNCCGQKWCCKKGYRCTSTGCKR